MQVLTSGEFRPHNFPFPCILEPHACPCRMVFPSVLGFQWDARASVFLGRYGAIKIVLLLLLLLLLPNNMLCYILLLNGKPANY